MLLYVFNERTTLFSLWDKSITFCRRILRLSDDTFPTNLFLASIFNITWRFFLSQFSKQYKTIIPIYPSFCFKIIAFERRMATETRDSRVETCSWESTWLPSLLGSLLHSARVHSALLRADPPSRHRLLPIDLILRTVPQPPYITDTGSGGWVMPPSGAQPSATYYPPPILRLSRALDSPSARSVCEYTPLFSIYISRSVWGLPVEDLLTLTALPSPASIPVSRGRLGSIPRLSLANVKHADN